MFQRGHSRFKSVPLNGNYSTIRFEPTRVIYKTKKTPTVRYKYNSNYSIKLTFILPGIISCIFFFLLLGTGTLDNVLLWPRIPTTIVFPGNYPSSKQIQTASLDSSILNFSASKAAFTTHLVSDGETIVRIAYRYGLSPITIASVNAFQSPEDMKKDSQLIIPYRDGLRYTVSPDKTIEEAVKRLKLPPEKIQILPNGDLFVPGQPRLDDLSPSFRQNLFVKPVKGRIIVPFGNSIDPLTGISWKSNGIDIAADKNTSILSSRKGTVLRTGRHSSFGLYVMVEHSGGWVSFYGYLGRIDVAPGNSVDRGVSIGLSGQSGTAHSPRVHFALFHNGEPVDPFWYLY